MAERTSELGTKDQLARLLTQQRITGSDDEVAVSHEINRQNTVKQILVHVFLMSKFRFFTGPLSVVAAAAQYLRASGDDQAAHGAPGQIQCAGVPIHKLIVHPTLTGPATDLRLIVECLFGNTDEIHRKFNYSDSRAEENGMRRAFGDACTQVANSGKTARFNRAEEFHHHVEGAFRNYKAQSLQAIDRAINIQDDKIITGAALKGVTRQELINILEGYYRELTTSSDGLWTVQGLDTEALWRDYGKIRH